MDTPRESSRRLDSTVLLFLFALFVLVSPVLLLWATVRSPWYLPYLLWLVVIALIAWVSRSSGDHDV
jgi:fatty acid desaturase